MTCEMCQERGKIWAGDDPVCYFDNSEGNWGCTTIEAIRGIVEGCITSGTEVYGVHYQYCDDEWYATIKTDEIKGVSGLCLFIQWYKFRGHTDVLWVMDRLSRPRTPSEKELLAVVKYYRKTPMLVASPSKGGSSP